MALGRYDIRFVLSMQDRTKSAWGKFDRDLRAISKKRIEMTEAEKKAADKLHRSYMRAYAAMDLGRAMQLRGILGTAAFGFAAEQAAKFETSVTKAVTQAKGIGDATSIMAQSAVAQQGILDQMQVFPQSADAMSQALYDIYGTLDVPLKEGLAYLRLFNMVAVAGGAELEEVSSVMITLANNFGRSFGAMEQSAESAFSIIKYGRLEFSEFSSMMNQLVPAMARSNQSLRSMGGAMAFLTGKIPSQQQVSTALARLTEVFDRPDFKRGAKMMGLSIVNATGDLIDFRDIIKELSRLKVKPADIIPVVTSKGRGGGPGIQSTIQARKALSLLIRYTKDYLALDDKVRNNQKEFERRYVAMYGTAGMAWMRLKAQMQAFVITVGAQVIPVFEKLLAAAQTFFAWAQQNTGTVKMVATFTAAFFIMSLVAGSFVNLVAAGRIFYIAIASSIIPALARLMASLLGTTAAGLMLQGVLASLASMGVIAIAVVVTFLFTKPGKDMMSRFDDWVDSKLPGSPAKWLEENGPFGDMYVEKKDRKFDSVDKIMDAVMDKLTPDVGKFTGDFKKNMAKVQRDLKSQTDALLRKELAETFGIDPKEYEKMLNKQLNFTDSAAMTNSIVQKTKDILDQAKDGLENLYKQFRDENTTAMGTLFQGPWMSGEEMKLRKEWNWSTRIDDMIKDMKMQTNQFKKWRGGLNTLLKRGIPKDMVEELRKMGAEEGLPIVQAMLKGTPGQIKELANEWRRRKKTIDDATKYDFTDKLNEWNKFGSSIALQIAAGIMSEEQTLTTTISNMVDSMWTAAAVALATKEAVAEAATAAATSNVDFGLFPKVPPVKTKPLYMSAAAQGRAKEMGLAPYNPWLPGVPGHRPGRTTNSRSMQSGGDTIIFEVNGIFMSEREMMDTALRLAATKLRNKR